jgi:hypothetical protein
MKKSMLILTVVFASCFYCCSVTYAQGSQLPEGFVGCLIEWNIVTYDRSDGNDQGSVCSDPTGCRIEYYTENCGVQFCFWAPKVECKTPYLVYSDSYPVDIYCGESAIRFRQCRGLGYSGETPPGSSEVYMCNVSQLCNVGIPYTWVYNKRRELKSAWTTGNWVDTTNEPGSWEYEIVLDCPDCTSMDA